MDLKKINLEELSFSRAKIENVGELLAIIRRCMNEVNRKDYAPREFEKYLSHFTADWLSEIITTRHYYETRCRGKIVACGGVSRDQSKENQSYFTAIFVNPDFHGQGIGRKLIEFLEKDEWCLQSSLIEIPSSKTACKFYRKCGYAYRNVPPVFSEEDGSTIMYKEVAPQILQNWRCAVDLLKGELLREGLERHEVFWREAAE